jgi:two-component system, chemotaxis family, chemotaxis protein CheY
MRIQPSLQAIPEVLMKYIVIIDDSITIRSSVEFTLKSLGYPIKQCENGDDAIKKIKELKDSGNEISLCITDVNMPVMDGITFVKHFRTTDKFTPVLMLTTESEDNKIQSGKDAGASGWLVKPFKSDQLINVVNKLLK